MIAVLLSLTVIIYFAGNMEAITRNVLLGGNLIVFVLSFLSYFISSRYTQSSNNSQFMRGVLGGTFLKFFLALVIGLIYIVVNKADIKIGDILGLMLLYIIYSSIETAFLAKSSRTKS